MNNEYKYTLIFLKHQDQVLMLNTVKGMWMGMWNGVGGKIEKGETQKQGALRETEEETGIKLNDLDFKTIVTWEVIDEDDSGGMYIYLKELDNIDQITTPYYSPAKEGILDWKSIDWIFNPKNRGVIANIKTFLFDILNGQAYERYHCIYKDHDLVKIIKSHELNE
jgi:8-oxo-dGTP diphosphatase